MNRIDDEVEGEERERERRENEGYVDMTFHIRTQGIVSSTPLSIYHLLRNLIKSQCVRNKITSR